MTREECQTTDSDAETQKEENHFERREQDKEEKRASIILPVGAVARLRNCLFGGQFQDVFSTFFLWFSNDNLQSVSKKRKQLSFLVTFRLVELLLFFEHFLKCLSFFIFRFLVFASVHYFSVLKFCLSSCPFCGHNQEWFDKDRASRWLDKKQRCTLICQDELSCGRLLIDHPSSKVFC